MSDEQGRLNHARATLRAPCLAFGLALVTSAGLVACSSASPGQGPPGAVASRTQKATSAPGVFAEVTQFKVKTPVPDAPRPAFKWLTSQVVNPGLTVSAVARNGVSVLQPNAANSRASVALPEVANVARSIRDLHTGMSLDIGLEGATAAHFQKTGGLIAWPHGYLGKYDIFATANRDEFEEDVVFFHAPAENRLTYDVGLSSQVKGLRSVGDTVEFLTASGDPRLRLNTPYVVGSNGQARKADVQVVGCRYDTKTRPPWGRPVTPPGASDCRIEVTWDDTGLRYPLLLDPGWSDTAVLGEHVYALQCAVDPVAPGVVCFGGIVNGIVVDDTYASSPNPAPGNVSWSSVGPMRYPTAYGAVARYPFDNTFAVADGISAISGSTVTYTTDVELYYPGSYGVWFDKVHTATARVVPGMAEISWDWLSPFIIAGGWNASGYLGTTEIWDGDAAVYQGPALYDSETTAYHTVTHCVDSSGTDKVIIAGGYGLLPGGNQGYGVQQDTNIWYGDNNSQDLSTGYPLIQGVWGATANAKAELGIGALSGYRVFMEGGFQDAAGSNPWNAIQRNACGGAWAWGANPLPARAFHVGMMVRSPTYGYAELLTAGGTTNSDNDTSALLNSTMEVTLGVGVTYPSTLVGPARDWAGGTAGPNGHYGFVVGGWVGTRGATNDAEIYDPISTY